MKRDSPVQKPACSKAGLLISRWNRPAAETTIMTRVLTSLAAAAALAVLAVAVPANADLRPDDTGRHSGSWHGPQWDADPAGSHGYASASTPAARDASPAFCARRSARLPTVHTKVGIG